MSTTQPTTQTYFTNFQVKLLPDDQTRAKIWEILKRDSKVINRILGIMNFEEKTIYSLSKSGKKYQTSRTILNNLMIVSKNRANVKYDLKHEFPTISNNELQECLDNANEMYLSYLNTKLSGRDASKPHLSRTISRRIDRRRFEIDPVTHTFRTIYSCKSNLKIWSGQQTRVLHDRIEMSFVPNLRTDDHLTHGEVKTATIQRYKGNFYLDISVAREVPTYQPPPNVDLGMIGVDLGIAKTATAVLVTNKGITDSIILNDNVIKRKYIDLEKKIAKLQQEKTKRNEYRYRKFFHYMAEKVEFAALSQYLLHLNRQIKKRQVTTRMISHALQLATSSKVNAKYRGRTIRVLEELSYAVDRQLLGKIKSLGSRILRLKYRRAYLKDEMIKYLCNELSNFILKYNASYDLYVTIGKPNGIQYRKGRRGSGNKWLRKKINQWAFYKFQQQLRHNMDKLGMGKRLIEVGEAWTSSICHQCNRKGDRPRQEDFYCQNYHCLLQINADINGATNIAKRGILYKKLVDDKELSDYFLETKQEQLQRKQRTKFYKEQRKVRSMSNIVNKAPLIDPTTIANDDAGESQDLEIITVVPIASH